MSDVFPPIDHSSSMLILNSHQVLDYVSDQCMLKYRQPEEAKKQVELLLASAPKVHDEDINESSAKATVIASPKKPPQTRSKAAKAAK
jgi:hypothetical protein